MKSQVSPQYLREENIYVTIIEVKSPVYYVIKESPSMDTISTYASRFLELEESMQKYYRSLEKTFFQLPVKDTVLIVEHEKKYYRAKVCSILNLPRSYLIKVYLLDYGKECSVPKSSLFEMHPDFLSVPFQVIDFKLPGLEPMSLIMDPHDLAVEYGTATDWDPSASIFIEGMRKALRNAFVKVEGAAKNCIFGTLHVTFPDGEEKCVNDELVFKKFASQNPDCWNGISRLAEILSKENLPSDLNVLDSQSNNPNEPKLTSVVSKSLPDSELKSPESPKSIKSSTSTIVSKPLRNTQKSSVEKLREILRSKKSQEQRKSFPQETKESPPQSNTEGKSLKQKNLKELEKSGVELLEDIKDVYNVINEAAQNVEKHSTEREPTNSCEETKISKNVNKDSPSTSKDIALKTSEVNKCDQSVSVAPNASTFQKFREMVARKRAAQKQQNLSQTLSDNSCPDSPSRIETVSTPTNAHSLEFGKSEKISHDVNTSASQVENVRSDLSPAAPTCNKFANPETRICRLVASKCQPVNSVTVQDVDIAESVPVIKSDSEQSVESRSSSEQEEISKKVDPAKIRAFFERSKKARALFLAQNKSKQEQDNTNSQLAASSETETHLVASGIKTVEKSCRTSKSSETRTEITAIDTKNVEVELCGDRSDGKKLELAESLESYKSMESQMSTEVVRKEIAKPKVGPGKLTMSFEQNRKDRALFLAQSKSKEDQDNKSSQSETISPPSVVHLPTEIDKISTVAPEPNNMGFSSGNDTDILELVNESSDSNSISHR